MTLDESVHGMRLRVIERAQVLGNVSAVCRELGISRTLFYRWRKRLERYGVDGVHPRRQRGRAGRPVATPPEVERLALGMIDTMDAPPRARWLLDENATAPAGFANTRAGF